jgi:hypothetical protein
LLGRGEAKTFGGIATAGVPEKTKSLSQNLSQPDKYGGSALAAVPVEE